jgi:hypothetical protein
MKNWFVTYCLLLLANGCWLLTACQSGLSQKLPSQLVQQSQGGKAERARPDKPKHGGKAHKDFKSQRDLARQLANVTKVPKQTFYIDRSLIEEILNQPECKGIRIYLSKATPGSQDDYQLILVGTKLNPGIRVPKDSLLDLVTPPTQQVIPREYVVGLTEDKCPANCDTTSPYYK